MLSKLKKVASLKNRARKYKLFKALVKKDDIILDIGINPDIKYLQTNYLEKNYDLDNILICLGLNSHNFSEFKTKYPKFKLVTFDGFNFPKFDSKIDISFCNAVIEHVGNYDSQLQWLKSISNITNTIFITTPNKYCPYDSHTEMLFVHWFPNKAKNYIYKKLKRDPWINNLWLLSKRKFVRLLEQSGFQIQKIVKNKILFFTIDYVIIAKSKQYSKGQYNKTSARI